MADSQPPVWLEIFVGAVAHPGYLRKLKRSERSIRSLIETVRRTAS